MNKSNDKILHLILILIFTSIIIAGWSISSLIRNIQWVPTMYQACSKSFMCIKVLNPLRALYKNDSIISNFTDEDTEAEGC